jgi:hypothetical protein
MVGYYPNFKLKLNRDKLRVPMGKLKEILEDILSVALLGLAF